MNNTVILNKDASTWPRIKKYFEERGVNTHTFLGKDIGSYYGVIDGRFGAFAKFTVNHFNADIIELPEESSQKSVCAMCGGTGIIGIDENSGFPQSCPCGAISKLKAQNESTEIIKEEKKYPRVMLVWDDGEEKKKKRIVVCEHNEKFIATGESGLEYLPWDYATEFTEEIEVPIEELIEGYAALKGVSKELVKVKM